MRAAVVAHEEDQRVLCLLRLIEFGHHGADRGIHRAHHGRVGAAVFFLDVLHLFQPLRRCLQRRVRRVEGQVKHPRLSLARVTSDIRRRLVTKLLREVFRLRFIQAIAIQRDGVLRTAFATGEIDMPAAQSAEVLVKTALHRVKLRMRAEMPFPHRACRITRLLHQRRKRRFIQRKPRRGALRQPRRIVLMPEAMLVTPRQQTRARRAAKRVRNVAIRAAQPTRRELVEIRRRDLLRALKAHVVVTQIIRDDDEDVRWRGENTADGEEKKKQGAHGL